MSVTQPLSLPNFLANKLGAVQALARAHHVQTLEVFGSVLTGRFGEESDVDLLVKFAPLKPVEYSHHYFALKHGLEDLLGRNVDLLEVETLDNPYFLNAIRPERTLIYAT